jgi:hypothetical protein
MLNKQLHGADISNHRELHIRENESLKEVLTPLKPEVQMRHVQQEVLKTMQVNKQ